MPELPDVAGFKKYLDATALHQRIRRSKCFEDRFVKEVSRAKLQKKLKGAELERSMQWGKWLLVELSTGGYLVLHFGMTGQLTYGKDEGDLPDHTRFALYFDNDRRLAIVSQRMLGQVSYTDDPERMAESHDLGPDALSVNKKQFVEMMTTRSGSVKSALMNQSVIAGIGNVYSDEILFQSGVHPKAEVKKLDESTLRKVHTVMRRVLKTASKKGGDGLQAPKSWLLSKRGEGESCPKCDGPLKSVKVNSRTAWFCQACQKKGA